MQNIVEEFTNQELMESKIKKALENMSIDEKSMTLKEAYQRGFEDAIGLIKYIWKIEKNFKPF